MMREFSTLFGVSHSPGVPCPYPKALSMYWSSLSEGSRNRLQVCKQAVIEHRELSAVTVLEKLGGQGHGTLLVSRTQEAKTK